MKKVFVSGCYDILHGGHVEFFNQAKGLGDHLVVCIPSDEVLFAHKKRRPFIPVAHKIHLISSLEMVDEVVVGEDREIGMNFRTRFISAKPQFLAVTDDDQFETEKRKLCEQTNARYVRLPKELSYQQISTTQIFERLRAPAEAPVRIDLAGGWLDVPRFAREDGFIVNCAVSPLVSLYDWPYEKCSGMGGSGAYALLMAEDGVQSELDNNVGWQDPVVINETGLCVWRSGARPILEAKVNPSFLYRKMAIHWTGKTHNTNELSDRERDYELLVRGGQVARDAVMSGDYDKLCEGVRITHEVQLKEGMDPLPSFGEKACKYCGSGHGGYAVYLFDERPKDDGLIPIEPYMRTYGGDHCKPAFELL